MPPIRFRLFSSYLNFRFPEKVLWAAVAATLARITASLPSRISARVRPVQVLRRIYIVAVAQKPGVLCKSCGKGIAIDDEYIPGIRAAEIATSLYSDFYKHFPQSVKDGVADSANKPWQKTLTCGIRAAGRPTHTKLTICVLGSALPLEGPKYGRRNRLPHLT
jgi:hypothetical protein